MAARRIPCKFVEKRFPFGDGRQRYQRQEGVVQLIGIANFRPRFRCDLFDRSRINRTVTTRYVRSQSLPQLNGTGPAFFQRSIVQKCVWDSR